MVLMIYLDQNETKTSVLPRQIAMYLMRRELHTSFPKIARSLGRKDHTTAIHSIDKIEKQLAYNEDLKDSLMKIKESLVACNKGVLFVYWMWRKYT